MINPEPIRKVLLRKKKRKRGLDIKSNTSFIFFKFGFSSRGKYSETFLDIVFLVMAQIKETVRKGIVIGKGQHFPAKFFLKFPI